MCLAGDLPARRLALALLVACVGLGLLTARAVEQGEAAVQESDRAFDQGKVHEAAHHARRAAVYYAPGAPHLHFAVARAGDPRRWWAGTPVDPKPYLR